MTLFRPYCGNELCGNCGKNSSDLLFQQLQGKSDHVVPGVPMKNACRTTTHCLKSGKLSIIKYLPQSLRALHPFTVLNHWPLNLLLPLPLQQTLTYYTSCPQMLLSLDLIAQFPVSHYSHPLSSDSRSLMKNRGKSLILVHLTAHPPSPSWLN